MSLWKTINTYADGENPLCGHKIAMKEKLSFRILEGNASRFVQKKSCLLIFRKLLFTPVNCYFCHNVHHIAGRSAAWYNLIMKMNDIHVSF